MQRKHAKKANDDKKPHKPKLKVTAKPSGKPKTSPKPKPSAKTTSKPKTATKPVFKPSPKPKPMLKPAIKSETVAKQYPEGEVLSCTVHYTIYYIGSHEPTVRAETFSEPCKLVFDDLVTGLQLSIIAARQARAKIWDEWVKFRNRLEKHPPVNSPAKIDWIRINKTEYSAGRKGDAEITTRFIDEYVRSIAGYSDIPRDF